MKPSPKKPSSRQKQRKSSSSSHQSSPSQHAGSAVAQMPPMRGMLGNSDSSGNDAGNSVSSREKYLKSYAGLSARSVRTIWEQHDKQETEVMPDVYNKLAEDTTYKLWELANNIKTYCRHSSGRVTYDLVNEVLKDADVPPIVGANSEPWDKIEYDGVYFFNSDEVLDLREEYVKDVRMEQCNVPVLTTTWMAESEMAEDLIDLYNNVCDAIYIGDEDCFTAAIQLLITNPHIPTLMKLLLTKAIEMLGFEYTEDTLRRSLQYLEALVRNYHIANSDLTLELSLLSQLFVNLLLGPAELVHAKFGPSSVMNLNQPPASADTAVPTPGTHHQTGMETMSPIFNNSIAILENNMPTEDSNNSNSNATEELLRSIENIKEGPGGLDMNNIKDEYEALFSMVQGLGKQDGVDDAGPLGDSADGFQVKTEYGSEFEGAAPNFLVQDPHTAHSLLPNDMLNSLGEDFEMKQEPDKIKQEAQPLDDQEENVSLQMSESSNGEVNNPNSTTLECENITTLICEDYLVEDVCRVIGLCASKWGFVEQECTFLLVERLQRYFQDSKPVTLDYNWLSRIFRGLWSIGEFALRELIPYFQNIDTQCIPDYVVPHFNAAGIFLSGRKDVFLYEYLSDICGDGMLPFMFSYEQYIERKHTQYHRQRQQIIKLKSCYRVTPKVQLKKLNPIASANTTVALADWFEEIQTSRLPALVSRADKAPVSKFGFRFAGCRPMTLKTGRQRLAQNTAGTLEVSVKQNESLLKSFNAKIIVARRRLFTSDTNEPAAPRVFCYGTSVL